MRAIAIDKAQGHLELARAATDRLTLDAGFRPLEQAWSEFLSQASRFYSKLEQGAKGCAKSEPWFGQKKNERRGDPLLAYLHQARNSDEHGLDCVTARAADSISLHFPPTDEITSSFEMMIDDQGRMHVRNPQVQSPNGGVERVQIDNPRVELVTVRNRGIEYPPPLVHRGKPIVDRTLTGLAKMAIRSMEDTLKEATALPRH